MYLFTHTQCPRIHIPSIGKIIEITKDKRLANREVLNAFIFLVLRRGGGAYSIKTPIKALRQSDNVDEVIVSSF